MNLRQFIKSVADVVAQQKGQMALKLAKGQCGSMEIYNREVGRMEGMDITVSLLRDMLTQIEDRQSEGDQLPEMPPMTPPPAKGEGK